MTEMEKQIIVEKFYDSPCKLELMRILMPYLRGFLSGILLRHNCSCKEIDIESCDVIQEEIVNAIYIKHIKIQPILDCEVDCIKSGNSLSPKEQKVALDVISNIQQRMYGRMVKND